MSNLYDIIIIGGGIHGVGVAQAAAAAGFQVALLEQRNLAVGTSSRSSKLIHGGIRYLETGQFRLVRELLHERELLLKNAPELVHLEQFYIPVYKQTTRRPWQIRTGLALYAALGAFRPSTKFRKIPRSHWSSLDDLRVEGLQEVYQYYDAQADDAELTRSVMRSAIDLGARLHCPMQFIEARANKDLITVTCRHEKNFVSLTCRTLVNAAGPWINEVVAAIKPPVRPMAINLVQGSHIVIDHKNLSGIYYVESKEDKRGVFIMPWENKVLVGSTETLFTGKPENVKPLPREITYLQNVLHDYFPKMSNEVLESFSGLRVLPQGSSSMFRRSREVILHRDKSNPKTVNIYGGKLTNYRATSEQVVSLLKPYLPVRKKIAPTAELPLKPVNGVLTSSC